MTLVRITITTRKASMPEGMNPENLEEVADLFSKHGVILDKTYGPCTVNPEAGTLCYRGTMYDPTKHMQEVRTLPYVQGVFSDGTIKPAKNKPDTSFGPCQM